MLPKNERLSRDKDIRETIRGKQYTVKTPLLYLTARDNSLTVSRLVVAAPKRLGKAVTRNRLRRIIVNAYSKNKHKLGKNIDIVIIPGNEAVGKTTQELGTAINHAIKCLNYENVYN